MQNEPVRPLAVALLLLLTGLMVASLVGSDVAGDALGLALGALFIVVIAPQVRGSDRPERRRWAPAAVVFGVLIILVSIAALVTS